VGESLEDDERSTRVVDRFLADVESMQAAEATAKQDGGR
jgi:F-type H+-transporting ATPase subunit b